MPKTKVVFYKEDDGSVPILKWLDSLEPKAVDKCTLRIERLAELGHELRRSEADFLRDGIWIRFRGFLPVSHPNSRRRNSPPLPCADSQELRARTSRVNRAPVPVKIPWLVKSRRYETQL